MSEADNVRFISGPVFDHADGSNAVANKASACALGRLPRQKKLPRRFTDMLDMQLQQRAGFGHFSVST
jgi:hypothetical protein